MSVFQASVAGKTCEGTGRAPAWSGSAGLLPGGGGGGGGLPGGGGGGGEPGGAGGLSGTPPPPPPPPPPPQAATPTAAPTRTQASVVSTRFIRAPRLPTL